MITGTPLTLINPTALVLALVVEIVALLGWLRSRWLSLPARRRAR